MSLRKTTEMIVVHVTATPPSADIGAEEVDRMHRARGWSGIGYHFVIRRDGRIEKGREEAAIGAHVAGFNSHSLGVAMVGGVDASGKPEHNATPAQMEALEGLLRELVGRYPDARICGHRDLSPDRDHDGLVEPWEHLKACPCFDAIPWAVSKGLPAMPIKGIWSEVGVDDAPPAPDARNRYLQKLLHMAGYEFGPLDGIVGPRTRAAARRFQKSEGFSQTGEFDRQTAARLRAMFEV